MKVGDIVKFRGVNQPNGSIKPSVGSGIITMASSFDAFADPDLRLYWVLSNTRVRCFTGRQLVSV